MRIGSRTGAAALSTLILITVANLSAGNGPADLSPTWVATGVKNAGWSDADLGTELQLPEAQVYERPDGRLGLRVRVNFGFTEGTVRIVSFLNKKDRSFRVFVLDDITADTRRISAYLQERGLHVPVEAVLEHLEARERRDRERASAERTRIRTLRPWPVWRALTPSYESEIDEVPGLDVGSDDWVCSGNLSATSETWEPAKLFFDVDELTETHINADIMAFPNSHWGMVNSHWCWSNPNTFAFTTWITQDCLAGPYSEQGILEYYQAGEYRNYDFANDESATDVSAGVAIGWSNWQGSWTDHYYEESPSNNPFENLLLSEDFTPHNSVRCWYPPIPTAGFQGLGSARTAARPQSAAARANAMKLSMNKPRTILSGNR